MTRPTSIAGAAWFGRREVRAAFAALDGETGRTRAVGGVVRDTLLDIDAAEVDLATEFTPEEVTERAQAAGIDVHPTGIAHGTVTLVHRGRPIEVTTLRRDIETDGRHAVVRFGTDWSADAERRDFTINAIYAFQDGRLYDPLDGIDDCLARRIRFIGDPDQRIAEDYLRVLRFFRLFAVYGEGRPDADGLKACARARDRLDGLSAERVWSELKKLLGAHDPARALLWMRSTGVLAAVLPESDKWGVDAVPGVIEAGAALGWPDDPIVRLMGMVPPRKDRIATLAERLRLSNAERDRLLGWAASDIPVAEISNAEFARFLYAANSEGVADRLRLAIAAARAQGQTQIADRLIELLAIAQRYERPVFPVSGKDLVARGSAPGPDIGQALDRLEQVWVASDFTLTRDELLANKDRAD